MEGFSKADATGDVSDKINLSSSSVNTCKNYVKVDKKHFNNLSIIIEKIEEQREIGYNGNKTIKSTINNPSSSRSIIFVDIKVKIDGKFVPLVLVDMPGRENIYESYKSHITFEPGFCDTEEKTKKL